MFTARDTPNAGHRGRALRLVAGSIAMLWSTACLPSDESAADPFDPAVLPRLQLTEVAEIGRSGDRPGPVLNRVTDAIMLDAEEIALASDEGEILVYGVRGDYRRGWGRRGEGPGEFRFIQDIVRLDDDRILAWDPALARATVFTRDGRLDFTCTPPWARSQQAGVEFVGAFADGTFVLGDRTRRAPLPGTPDGLRSDTIPFLLFDRSGEQVRTIARFVLRPRRFDARSGFQSFLLDSSVQFGIVGDELLVGETDAIALQRFDSTGTALTGLRLERPPRPVTEPDLEAAWLAWGEQMVLQQRQMLAQAAATSGSGTVSVTRQEAEEAIAGYRETVEPAGFLPAYKSMIVGGDRALWLEDYLHPTEDVTRWFLMDDGFLPVGWIELPPRERLLAAGPDRLLVLRKDALDVESVVVYGGEWPATGR